MHWYYLLRTQIFLIALSLVICLLSFSLQAQIPPNYYNTATGTGFTLKTQLYNIIKNHSDLGYTALWTTYGTSDRDLQYENDNSIVDLYSENPIGADPAVFQYQTDQCGSYTTQGQCYNREHVIPDYVFNSASPMRNDAHVVIPVDGFVNNIRANYPHGNVAIANFTSSNGSKRGSSAVVGYSGTVFEPLNEFKGDIARIYFYFATRYQNTVASYNGYPMFNGTSDTVFNGAFLTMLMSWHNQDPVSAREISRNNAIYQRQHNRNPFIDHPEYVGFIWGTNQAPSNQSITFSPLPNVMIGSSPFTLSASASSGLAVSYTSSNTNVATISNNVVSIVGVGTTQITASQAGNANYNPASSVTQSLTVTNPILVAWDMSTLPGGVGNFGPSPYAPTLLAANCNGSGLIRGSGLATPNSTAAARAWGGTVNTATANTASSSNTSISFTLQANAGFSMSLSSINPFDYRRSSTGATNGLLQYSINGGPYSNISTVNFSSSASAGGSVGTIDLSSVPALQQVHSSQIVNIRILPYGGTGGTFYIFDRAVSSAYDFTVNGLINPCLPSASSSSISIAQSAIPFMWHGQSLTNSGIYTATLINSKGCDSILTLDLTVLPSYAELEFKAFIQGYYSGAATMVAALHQQGASGNTLISDSIDLELRQANAPFYLAHSAKTALMTDGSSNLTLDASHIGNSYYLVLKHRNSVEVWSAQPIAITQSTFYDFSNAANKVFGSNQKEMDNGVWALFSGDIDQNTYLELDDYNIWDIAYQSGFPYIDYTPDLDGNGYVELDDYNIWDVNYQNGVYGMKP